MVFIFNKMINSEWLSKLGSSGYRLTESRKAIVQVLSSCNQAMTPADLYFKVHQSYPSIGLVTIYRTIEKLEELGLVQRVFLEEGGFGYFPRNGSHRHLLICKDCHRVEEFSGDDLAGLMLQVETQSGFEVQDHLLQFTGLCSNCR